MADYAPSDKRNPFYSKMGATIPTNSRAEQVYATQQKRKRVIKRRIKRLPQVTLPEQRRRYT